MTTHNVKTILFTSLIAAMILPFSAMDFAVAEEIDEKKLEELAKKANKIMKDLETVDSEDTRATLQEELDKITTELNQYGLYTEDQFEQIKTDRLSETPSQADQDAASLQCSCNPELWFRTGFDYKKWGWTGSTNGNWVALDASNTKGISEAATASWGVDYMDVWNNAFVKNGATASATFGTMIESSSDKTVKDYGTSTKTITTSPSLWYVSRYAYNNVNGGDAAVTAATLKSIS